MSQSGPDELPTRPWLAHYPRDVPHSIAGEEGRLGQLVAAMAARYPDRPFGNVLKQELGDAR